MNDDTRRTRLEEALLGAVFPLSTKQLVLLAQENEAPFLVVSLLSNLPGRRFDSLDAVQRALESQAGEEATEAPPAPMPPR